MATAAAVGPEAARRGAPGAGTVRATTAAVGPGGWGWWGKGGITFYQRQLIQQIKGTHEIDKTINKHTVLLVSDIDFNSFTKNLK